MNTYLLKWANLGIVAEQPETAQSAWEGLTQQSTAGYIYGRNSVLQVLWRTGQGIGG